MTKQHFAALALMLKGVMPVRGYHPFYEIAYDQWKQDVNAVMIVCAADNPKFHKGKFMQACGIPNLMLP